MALNNLLKAASVLNGVFSLAEGLTKGEKNLAITGWAGSGKAWAIAGLFLKIEKPIAVVTHSDQEAETLKEDLESFLGQDKVKLFPSWEIDFLQAEAPEAEIIAERLGTLAALLKKENSIIVIPVDSLFQPTSEPGLLRENTLQLKVGEERDLSGIIQTLENLGFKRAAWVEEIGDYSARGGILDLFAYSLDTPARIEFFGNQIESIRTFSVLSQRSTQKLDSVTIFPLREYGVNLEQINPRLENLKPAARRILESAEYYQSNQPGWEWLTFLLGFQRSTVLDYLPTETILYLDEPELLRENQERVSIEWKAILSQARLTEFEPELVQFVEAVTFKLSNFKQIIGEALPALSNSNSDSVVNLGMQEPPALGGNFKLLEKSLEEYQGQGYRVHLVCDSQRQKERLQEILESWADKIFWEVGNLNSGFVVPELKLIVLADHQIFGRQPFRTPARRFKEGLAISSYKTLNPGDYVVHIDYGIGKFKGLATLILDGRTRECLELAYAGEDKLYVPIEEFRLVQKFIGKEGEPTLSRLGGIAWEKAKARVKKAIADMAEELLQLYAERKAKPGFSFSDDSLWQKELEASFPYQETPDQLRAIEEVKKDLQLAHPMDRLVCGDVGYGKTEVALRAAFKAVLDHKQVAVLVPTTILAFQHFNTFSERLKDFPVRVEMLSRFRTRPQQKKILDELTHGKVDIVIGTHMLLQGKVKFKDLGLLIIDEEHRFGVAQKEKIKKFKRLVDVLTLTATPIPRTMQMALFGARDMSPINTPPAGRLSIHTEIVRFNSQVVVQAILREIGRGGQVFFVHNRIQTIEGVYRFLKELLPEMKMAIAHGRMPEGRLEKIMLDFMAKKYDLLLSTTIIESGLDLSNVNTIIINRADKFGLAELYQLRGRVGRSNQRAYAYLLVPPEASLQETARKRLKALEQFSELGSGFHLALKDLEIRGAGNLLGPQQHGFIAEVGIDLYFRLLEQTIQELKGEKAKLTVQTKIESELEAYLPEGYVPDSRQRIEIYTKLSEAQNQKEVKEVEFDLQDRFGQLPEPVCNLLEISQLRLLAQSGMIEKIGLGDSKITWEYSLEVSWNPEKINNLAKLIDFPVEFRSKAGLKVSVTTGKDEKFNLGWLKKLLQTG
jgi:transcription-repair coupling factor (superfamily II helicase)